MALKNVKIVKKVGIKLIIKLYIAKSLILSPLATWALIKTKDKIPRNLPIALQIKFLLLKKLICLQYVHIVYVRNYF